MPLFAFLECTHLTQVQIVLLFVISSAHLVLAFVSFAFLYYSYKCVEAA